MRADWRTGQLGDFFEIVTGGTPSKAKKEMYGSCIPLVKPPELTGGGVQSGEDCLSEKGAAASRILPVDSVLVSCIGNLGKIGISKVELATNQQINSIKPNADKALPEFVFYLVQAPHFSDQLHKLASGTTVPIVNKSKFKSILVDLPSLPEQKRIVAILDEAFEGIGAVVANTEKSLANASELFESYLSSVFRQRGEGWCVKAVGDFADHCLGKMLDKQKNKGEMKSYLRNVNVQWFGVTTDDLLQMKIENHEKDRYSVLPGDLLICEGGYPGRAAIWENDEQVFFQKALHRVRCGDQRYNRWLLYYLYFLDSRGELSQYFTGAGIQHFTGKALKAFPVPLAPPNILDELLSVLESVHEEIRSLESIYQRKLTALAELKQSLLQKAFSGELTAERAEAAVEEPTA